MLLADKVLEMRRRELMAFVIGGMASAIPAQARAQAAPPVLGLLSATKLADREMDAFRQGLVETGFVEGTSLSVEYRSGDGQYDRLPALAADLVDQQVAVLVAIGGTPSGPAAKAATATILVVFSNGSDPVALGLVSSLSRPGGNVTGVTFMVSALGAKRLALLRELVPAATTIGFLVNPPNPNAASDTSELQAAALSLGLRVHVGAASTEHDIKAAFGEARQAPSDHAPRCQPADSPSQNSGSISVFSSGGSSAIGYGTRRRSRASGGRRTSSLSRAVPSAIPSTYAIARSESNPFPRNSLFPHLSCGSSSRAARRSDADPQGCRTDGVIGVQCACGRSYGPLPCGGKPFDRHRSTIEDDTMSGEQVFLGTLVLGVVLIALGVGFILIPD